MHAYGCRKQLTSPIFVRPHHNLEGCHIENRRRAVELQTWGAMVSFVEVFEHALNRKGTPIRAPGRISKVILFQGIFYMLFGEPGSLA